MGEKAAANFSNGIARKIWRLSGIVFQLSTCCVFAQALGQAGNAAVPPAPWVEPDNLLLVTPLMLVEKSHRVSITFKNTTGSAWMPNEVSLRQTSPDKTWFESQLGFPLSAEQNQMQLARAVPPGDKITFVFQVRTPAERGRHELGWQLYGPNGPLSSTAVSRKVVVVTLDDVTPPGQPPPIEPRPVTPTPPPSWVNE